MFADFIALNSTPFIATYPEPKLLNRVQNSPQMSKYSVNLMYFILNYNKYNLLHVELTKRVSNRK